MPAFVLKAFQSFLRCGDPRQGFIHLFCDRCQHEHPLPFSCKTRSICPSCGARRAEETVAHLVNDVLPDVPIRQFVLSPPFELRGLLAARNEVLSKLSRVFVQAIFRRMKTAAKQRGLVRPQCGSVNFIQRFTKTLLISPHLHLLVLDGVFVDAGEGEPPRFVDLPAPTEEELHEILQDVWEKMTRYLRKNGYLKNDVEEDITATDRWFLRSLQEPSGLLPRRIPARANGVEYRGFSIHASVAIARGDRKGREQLCRYVARPPFAEEQFRLRDDGRVELELRSPARNGQRVITLEPIQLMRRLAWLIPPPGRHQMTYSGILAPAAKRRREVVPRPPPQIQLVFPIENMRPDRHRFRPRRAQLLAKVYSVDAEQCPRCGARMRPIGAVTDPLQAERQLARIHGARDPPQPAFAF